MAKELIAGRDVGGLRRDDVVHQPPAAELAKEATEPFDAGGMILRLVLEAAEDRRRERRGPGSRLGLADAELTRDGLEAAGLVQDVGDLHRGAGPLNVDRGRMQES